MLAADGKQMIASGVPRAVEYGHNLFRIARAIDHQANAQMPGSNDLSLQCPDCGWSTWNREVEQHICPGASDPS